MSSNPRQQLPLDGSAGSRTSLSSITQMPMITETGEINRAIPKIPLRVPHKHPRRSLPPTPHSPPGLATGNLGPAPYVPPDGSSPYNPTSPISLTASSPISPFAKENSLDADRGGNCSGEESAPQVGTGDDNEKQWLDNRQRRCRFMVMVGVFAAVIVGLAVGLSVGLSKKSNSSSSDGGSSNGVFPAGSFSLDTYLREDTTDCVSKDSAWTCYPDSGNSRATFYWTINAFNSYTYTISASGNPFIPSFSNLSATLVDPNQQSERLTFAFGMNKTVVPADAQTPTNRAANCTYTNTVFKATMWTRQRGNDTFAAPKHPSKFAPWPGDVEIMQYKNSTIGEPYCVDQAGGPIADVQAAGGTCMCRYESTSRS